MLLLLGFMSLSVNDGVMWGVCSSKWRIAEATFSHPTSFRNQSRLSQHQSSNLPLFWIHCICSGLPVIIPRIAQTWLWLILRMIPACSILYWIASVRFLMPSGNYISSRFKCVRSLSALDWPSARCGSLSGHRCSLPFPNEVLRILPLLLFFDYFYY